MSCQDTRTLLSAYADGELGLVRCLEIEKHLADCPACARAVENQRALTGAFRGGSFYYHAPANLQQRVQTALRGAAGSGRPHESRRLRISWPILAMAASLLVAGIFVDRLVRRATPENLMAQEILDSHLRALQPGHLADVQSSDRHTVKPWFAGKLDFSPPVADFAGQGFPLSGGRLDSLHGRTVAALVYHRAQHVINAYVLPSSSTDTPVNETALQGYNIVHWRHAGFEWWLASDLNSGELETLAGLLRAQSP